MVLRSFFAAIVILSAAPASFAEQIVQSSSGAGDLHGQSALPLDVKKRMESIMGAELKEPINCWGTALWTMGFTQSLKPALRSELLSYLDSPACRRLKPNEEVKAGDIGSIYKPELQQITHSYIVVDEDRIFEKRSGDKRNRPSIRSGLRDLKRCKDMYGERCVTWVINHRCDPNLIQIEREKYEVKFRLERQRMMFLKDALEQAVKSGSAIAVDDAFARYMGFIREKMKAASRGRMLLAAEAMDHFLVAMPKGKVGLSKLGEDNRKAFIKLREEWNQIEVDIDYYPYLDTKGSEDP